MSKKSYLYVLAVLIILLGCYAIFHIKYGKVNTAYYDPQILATHQSGEHYVGSMVCSECHADIYKNFMETAHFKTSGVANAENIRGHFQEGFNILDLKDVKFEMKKEADRFYQHTVIKNRNISIPPAKFDIVLGSGVRGQSYLTWQDDLLFQLQTSYYTPNDSWINSPGYPDYFLERPIRNACLQCHFTFIENANAQQYQNQYNRETIVYGVDCERCHRPSEKHVTYHKNNPGAKEPKFMLNMGSLTRKQNLDVCAQCHSGRRNNLHDKSSFSFLTGENLDEYSEIPASPSDDIPDVHGNQYRLLSRSKCFINSELMNCATCHDPHKNQRDNTEVFNQKCMSCHNMNTMVCASEESLRLENDNNCIACHMPLMPSNSMKAQVEKDSLETSFYIRTHLIGVYP